MLALAITVFLLAQAGVPFTSGFVAKFGVIQAAVEEHSYALAIIAMVASVIAAFLYLRIMVSMWVTDPESGDAAREPIRVPAWTGVALALSVGFTLADRLLPHLADRRHQSRRRRPADPPRFGRRLTSHAPPAGARSQTPRRSGGLADQFVEEALLLRVRRRRSPRGATGCRRSSGRRRARPRG